MNNWKKLSALALFAALTGCASQVAEQPVEKPVDEGKVVEVVPEPAPEPKVVEPEVTEPEVKPEPKPKPKPVLPTKTQDGKLILGEKEWVYFPGAEKSIKARVDTGATTSSVSAVDIEPFERDGKEWVKFTFQHGKVISKEITLPVERWVKVKKASEEEADRRPVVSGWIKVGDLKEKIEFTLVDRTHMEFGVLLGRNFFNDVAVVDVSRNYVQPKHK
ncbi:ATP-dependent zinc protease [Vibrio sp. SCSIO 43136]|uniref:ATP-dependent zinc protease family protein n=1 Tax=Vibrio sp. SCSIO 43136 TaxID=2819101 RepID=UPI0020763EAE|nr:ATP-dependent zinc protease [Vibrio sp. SCSIO 43136]USD66737.1 ATP-dependent zinc protease [Vibrio sp. SCSIO 43136]